MSVHVGVGEGWARFVGSDADLERLRAEGWQIARTPLGGVLVRNPKQPSCFQPVEIPLAQAPQIRET